MPQEHPFSVARELVNQPNSLRALVFACFMKADGLALERLRLALPEWWADYVRYSHEFNKG